MRFRIRWPSVNLKYQKKKGTGSVKVNYKITDCPDELYVEVFADTDSEGFDGTCVYSDNMEKNPDRLHLIWISFQAENIIFISVYP